MVADHSTVFIGVTHSVLQYNICNRCDKSAMHHSKCMQAMVTTFIWGRRIAYKCTMVLVYSPGIYFMMWSIE